MDIGKITRTFITKNFLSSDRSKMLEDSTSFLESGLVDSTGVLEIIQFLEETFAISVDDDELIPENLDSIENLRAFVARKLTEQSGQPKCAP